MALGIAGMVMSLIAMALSGYAIYLHEKRAAFEEILEDPQAYPEETRLLSCLIDDGTKLYPKFMCEYFGGDVVEKAVATTPR